jgi:uncharacterized protein (DUF58 family)
VAPGHRLQRWARRRQGPDQGTVELHARRVYILPTRTGLMLCVVLLTMLVGALNYSNNMGLALVFAIAALAVVSIHHCQANLAGLRVEVLGPAPVFAGEELRGRVRLHNSAATPRWQLRAGPDDPDTSAIDLAGNAAIELELRLATSRRGHVACPAIRLSTTYPLGLFRAWAWLHPELELLAYPRPADAAPAAMVLHRGDDDGAGHEVPGSDDFAGLRSLVPGEPPSRIAWKAFARGGPLLAKDYRGGGGLALLDWDAVGPAATEIRVALLARMVLDASSSGRPFTLRLPGAAAGPGTGSEHLHQCLRLLALHHG